ncbi:hypothetical protein [Modestobacter marinus]|uniref:hypothetical protein n=1 Tax=Modestobacter marinus TaxID=477641 RepID=UPI001C97063C|nr:hypothetical protein [Modestobacter marinus]
MIEAADASVPDLVRQDAVDLAVHAEDERRVAVDHGGLPGARDPGLAEAADDEAGRLVGAGDRPGLGLPDTAAVADENDLGREHVEQTLQGCSSCWPQSA